MKNRNLFPRLSAAVLLAWLPFVAAPAEVNGLRPPATPLVAHDPYFSIWSAGDRLTDENTKHWTGTEQSLTGLIRIDNKPYRFMGAAPRNTHAPAMNQVSREVTPTRTIYGFEAEGLRLNLTFLTPALPNDLDVLSRPVTYLTWDAQSIDSRPHDVVICFDASAQIATNIPEQRVMWSRHRLPGLQLMRIGTAEQPVLAKSGDNIRIDWGYAYVALPDQQGVEMAGTNQLARGQFLASGQIPPADDLDSPPQTSRNQTILATTLKLGPVGNRPVSHYVMLAYDDLFSIQYFHRNLRPYWRRSGWTAADLLESAARDYSELNQRARRFDEEITADLIKAGGTMYAAVAILAFRQTLAAHKLVADLDGSPLYMSKENFSNGCIDTVDVTYPSAPFFLLFKPESA